MYKTFTAPDLKGHLGLPPDYRVDGLLVFGTFQKYPYDMLRSVLREMDIDVTFDEPKTEFLRPIQEFMVGGKRYWFVVAYGGALLSEYLHLACLFGSRKNILLGSCGGLKLGANSRDLIVPDWSFGQESSAKAYQPEAGHHYQADKDLSARLAVQLSADYVVHRGATITYQAMLAETLDDVMTWSKQGYVGVEMEAATVFAASNHFKVPAAAILQIADNLVESETVLDINYESSRSLRRNTSKDMFRAGISELLAGN